MLAHIVTPNAKQSRWISRRLCWGPMPHPRANMLTWTTENRYFFVFGGLMNDPPEIESNSLYCLDTVSFEWKRIQTTGVVPPLESRVGNHMAHCPVTKKVYTLEVIWDKPDNVNISGLPSRNPITINLYVLDTETWVWTKLNTTWASEVYRPALYLSKIVAVGDKLVTYGGLNNVGNPVNNAYVLNLTTYQWMNLPSTGLLPAPRFSHSSLLIDSKMYCCGGKILNHNLKTTQYTSFISFHCLDTSKRDANGNPLGWIWSELRPSNSISLDLQRDGHSVVAGKNCIIIFGGSNEIKKASISSPAELNDLFIFELSSLKWADHAAGDTFTNGPSPRANAGMQLIGDKLFVFGGQSENRFYNDLYILKLNPAYVSNPLLQQNNTNIAPSPNNNNQEVPEQPKLDVTPVTPPTPPAPPPIAIKMPKFGFKSKKAVYHPPDYSGSSYSSESASGSSDGSGSESSYTSSWDSEKGPAPTNPLLEKIAIKPKVKSTTTPPTPQPVVKIEVQASPKDVNFPLDIAVDNKELFPDVEFKIGSTSIYAHKVLLSGASSVFQKKFDSNEQSRPSQSKKKTSEKSTVKSSSEKKKKGKNKNKEKEILESPTPRNHDDDNDSLSMWVGEVWMEPIKLPEWWKPSIFKLLLRYIYSGVVEVENKEEAKDLSEMAFEYLLDPLMKFCETQEAFPAVYAEAQEQKWKQIKRMVGRNIGSDVSFVFDRKKRLFAHKVFLCTFSEYFKNLLQSNKQLKYIEIEDLDSEQFVEYLKLLYTNFNTGISKKLDIKFLLKIAMEHKETRLLNFMANKNIFNKSNVGHIYHFAVENKFKDLEKESESYLEENFESIVKETDVIKNWPKPLIKKYEEILSGKHEDWCHFCSWYDLLWFGYNTGKKKMVDKAIKKLGELVNVENVSHVLVAAHTVYTSSNSEESKQLRTACVEYIIENGEFVEEYHRIKNSQQFEGSLSNLSESLTTEMTEAVKRAVNKKRNTKHITKTKVTIFNKKKRTCALCNRVVEPTEIQKSVVLPPVFGFKKPKQVCQSCKALVTLIKDS